MADRPPIIFVTADTQGRDMVSAYGPAHWHRAGAAEGVEPQLLETPNIDLLAARGTLFGICITASPLCTPARSFWYTGLSPNRNGALCNNLAPPWASPSSWSGPERWSDLNASSVPARLKRQSPRHPWRQTSWPSPYRGPFDESSPWFLD